VIRHVFNPEASTSGDVFHAANDVDDVQHHGSALDWQAGQIRSLQRCPALKDLVGGSIKMASILAPYPGHACATGALLALLTVAERQASVAANHALSICHNSEFCRAPLHPPARTGVETGVSNCFDSNRLSWHDSCNPFFKQGKHFLSGPLEIVVMENAMKISTKILALATLSASALALSATANAAAVQCDLGYDGYTRYMELTNIAGSPDPACFASGLVNEEFDDLIYKINFNEDGTVDDTEGPGPNPFDSFIGGGDNSSGSFSFVDGLMFEPGALIVFKFGGGQATPDWFAYSINGMTGADWELVCLIEQACQTGLSHVSVYGKIKPPVGVPEPGTLALLGLGLAGFGIGARRRQKIA
jgi:hypothetical protein